MSPQLDDSWRNWVQENLGRKCDPNELLEILVDNGFPVTAAREALGEHAPPVEEPVDHQALFEVALTREGSGAVKVETDLLQLYVVDDFLSEAECQRLIEISLRALRPSTLTTKEKDRSYRTSTTCDLSLLDDPFVTEIDEKLARTLGVRLPYSEGIQAQRYEVGQQFKQHTDYFQPGTGEYRQFGGPQGNRTWTFMVYLNTVERGGGTRFFSIDHTFQPLRGRAVVWNNLDAEGVPNPHTLHAGLPVEEGEKIIITKWFRERGDGPMF